MNQELYNLSSGLHGYLTYISLLTTSGFFAYSKAVDSNPDRMPKKEEIEVKLEEICKIERKQVLEILVESRRQLDILIDSVNLSPSVESS